MDAFALRGEQFGVILEQLCRWEMPPEVYQEIIVEGTPYVVFSDPFGCTYYAYPEQFPNGEACVSTMAVGPNRDNGFPALRSRKYGYGRTLKEAIEAALAAEEEKELL